MYDTVIAGGMVVTAERQMLADVAIGGESIAAVGPGLAREDAATIDATGCYLFPGFVDPHVHLSLPIGGGLVSNDDFTSGTIAAACGGTTTVIDFTTQERGTPLLRAVEQRRAEADGGVAIDYSLHVTVVDGQAQTLRDVQRLAADGYPSLKLYMTYAGLMVDDGELLAVLDTAAGCGALTMVHAESHEIITYLTRRLLAQGETGPLSHALSRPAWAEGEAVGRAIALARAARAPLYVVHVSCIDALLPIARARGEGQAVYAETCPHYLLLGEEEYSRPGFEGAKYVMTPPLRSQSNWPYLWDGLQRGTIDVVATDHCPWDYSGQKTRGRDRFDLIPGGIAGVETRGSLMFSEGVTAKRLTPERVAALLSTNPARLFGLYPRKGTIAAGSDADIVVVDPRQSRTLRQADLHQNVDYTVYEDWQVWGWPVMTMSRGRIVSRQGRFTGDSSHGRFVARQRIGQ
jgi:dihydropyrimidinase